MCSHLLRNRAAHNRGHREIYFRVNKNYSRACRTHTHIQMQSIKTKVEGEVVAVSFQERKINCDRRRRGYLPIILTSTALVSFLLIGVASLTLLLVFDRILDWAISEVFPVPLITQVLIVCCYVCLLFY